MINVTDRLRKELEKGGLRLEEWEVDEILSAVSCACRPEDVFLYEDLAEWANWEGFKNEC